ncbi:hypothetical protein TNCV_2306451 [Trichonephila clavipes]|nr:hypothetical protein TNCV_2306451 [Trichonephila clavipes]
MDAEDCAFQMLNDDEIVTSVQEESDPIDDETDGDEDERKLLTLTLQYRNPIESSKVEATAAGSIAFIFAS